jgi:hypothetical protein
MVPFSLRAGWPDIADGAGAVDDLVGGLADDIFWEEGKGCGDGSKNGESSDVMERLRQL